MTPIVDGLEQTYADRINFQRLNANTGDGPAIMKDYHILGHPVILLLNAQGQEIKRFIGPQPADRLAESLDAILTD